MVWGGNDLEGNDIDGETTKGEKQRLNDYWVEWGNVLGAKGLVTIKMHMMMMERMMMKTSPNIHVNHLQHELSSEKKKKK